MKLKMGSQFFDDVTIPLLWGTRAVLQDSQERLSIMDLSGFGPRLEVVGDQPAEGISFKLLVVGFAILGEGEQELYSVEPSEHRLVSLSLDLPEVTITSQSVTVGSSVFSGNTISGYGVGISVTKDGISMGSPLPKGLARLVSSV
jgi:hypothetical protein